MQSAQPACERRSLIARLRPAGLPRWRIRQMLVSKANLETAASVPATNKLALLGTLGGTHIGGSLARCAARLGIESIWFDADKASARPRLLRSLSWHLGRRPLYLNQFSNKLVKACAEAKPEFLLATGMSPLTESALRALRQLGIINVNYSTDDPWNPTMRSNWYLQALPLYDLIFTPRRSNLDDFQRLGCQKVHYLPFGYDETFFAMPLQSGDIPVHNVLFVGGADPDRVAFMTEFVRQGPVVAVAGGYWERYPAFRAHALGIKSPEVIRALTAAAKVNLCLVRSANRDGHVMRSFEIAAAGGCMLAQDTDEHREIFGPDGEAVAFFRDAKEAAQRARALLCDSSERKRLAAGLHRRIVHGSHTYAHRLATMLGIASRR
jgi:spore maturation protein CgeB